MDSASRAILYSLLFLLISISQQRETPFQILRQMNKASLTQFFAKQNDVIRLQASISTNATSYTIAIQNSTNSLIYKIKQNVCQATVLKAGLYTARASIYEDKTILSVKIDVYINNYLVRRHYQTSAAMDNSYNDRILYEFTTTRSCKVRVYWVDTPEFNYLVFPSTSSVYTSTPLFNYTTKTPRILNLPADKWYIYVKGYHFPRLNNTLILRTFTDNYCQNPCSLYRYPVVGLAPGTADICICDETLTSVFWNATSKKCYECINGDCKQYIVPVSCGNGIRQAGQDCDNGKLLGCQNCTVDEDYSCSEDIYNYSSCQPFPVVEKRFQILKQMVGDPIVQFSAKEGQNLNISIQKLGKDQDSTYTLTNADGITIVQSTGRTLSRKITRSTTYFIQVSEQSQDNVLFITKIKVYLDDFLIKQHYQAYSKAASTQKKIIYMFETNKTCKSVVYFTGNYSNYAFKIFKPTANIFSDPHSYQFTGSDVPYTFRLTEPGKWIIYLQKEGNGSAPLDLQLKTLQSYLCENPCSAYDYPVVGLAPGTDQICICDQTLDRVFWNNETKKCEQCINGVCKVYGLAPAQTCGNGVKEGSEQCDNGKKEGCSECMIENGFYCQEDSSMLSTCVNQAQKQKQQAQKKNSIIIGVCVGVGSAIIAGLAIYFLVKHLAAKTPNIYLDDTSKVNVNQGEQIVTKRKSESMSIIF